MLAAVRVALETEQGWLAEIRAERDQLLNRSWWLTLLLGQRGDISRRASSLARNKAATVIPMPITAIAALSVCARSGLVGRWKYAGGQCIVQKN